jgi:hypothetical protein
MCPTLLVFFWMTGTDQDDHYKVPPNADLDTSSFVKLVLPLPKALSRKLDP